MSKPWWISICCREHSQLWGLTLVREEVFFPSPGGLQGLPVAPSKLSSHRSASTLVFVCNYYLLKSIRSMRLKAAHAAECRQSLQSRVQAEVSVHSSLLLGKQWPRNQVKIEGLHLRQSFYTPPPFTSIPSTVQSFVCGPSQSARASLRRPAP